MKFQLHQLLFVITVTCSCVMGRPEPPAPQYPSGPGAASAPGSSYGAPAPSSGYGAPAPQYGPPSQAPIVHKHVYVHVAPPEQEYPAARAPIVVPPQQKHYKIVFIKAPTPPTYKPPVIPPPVQNEEKTLVYVLVKKPEEQPDIVIPTPAPTQPSKPEVFFIRYRTQKQEKVSGGYPDSISPITDYSGPSQQAQQQSQPQTPSSDYGAPQH